MAKNYGTFTTPGGVVLPLLDLKGKPYLQVAHRLVWFRELFPNGALKSQMIEKFGEGVNAGCTFRAEVYIPDQNGNLQLVATGHKSETYGDFKDYLEKAETASIGRALAMAGIGTQFCEADMDEGDRLADSPVDQAKGTSKTSFRTRPSTTTNSTSDDL